MNPSLPSSVCGSASDSSYAQTDQSSIHSSSRTSITSSTKTGKPKRTVRFQDPDPPTDSLAESISFQPGPNLSLSSLDLSSDDGSYHRRSRKSSSAASSLAGGKQPARSSSPRFSRPLSLARPSMRREHSVASTASAPGELEFTDWLARMEETRQASSSSSSSKDKRVPSSRASSKDPKRDADQEERKKKRRSWVNLLVR